MEPFRFTYQENQFNGSCDPCYAATFYNIARSAKVDRIITTRQAVETAIDNGLSLTPWVNDNDFRRFCQQQSNRPRAGAAFAALTIEQKLLQWVQNQKMWLPCFIFGVREFELVQRLDKQGNPMVDDKGQPVMYRRRKQPNIKELSRLFMFDGDHLPLDPYEVYERTKKPGFPWQLRLAHKTSSGNGLRLVCEARPEIGNIADNQIELARELGLLGMRGTTGKPVTDNSCVDASRISYAPRMKDIYYIDENNLFNH